MGTKTQSGYRSGHPGEPISGIGWIRWTGDHQGVHIDELQHDFHDENDQKAIEQVLGHPIARVLHEAFHEWVRNNPPPAPPKVAKKPKVAPAAPPAIEGQQFAEAIPAKPKKAKVTQSLPTVGTPFHVWTPESKAPFSGLGDDRDLPAHFKLTYRQIPEKMGLVPGKYGELPTQSGQRGKDQPTYKGVFLKSVKEIRESALAKSYTMAEPLQPKSTGIDNQVKVQSHTYPSNDSFSATNKSQKIETEFEDAPNKGSWLSKIRKNLAKKATGDAVTGKPDGMVVTAGDRSMVKGSLMPEATNKAPPKPSGHAGIKVQGNTSVMPNFYTHVEPGQAAHVAMDGQVHGTKVARQRQSGQIIAQTGGQDGEAATGHGHAVPPSDIEDGHEKQDGQTG
jgi:hypothetical protein